MGVVYKAQDTKLDRTVALKFLPPHLLADKEAEQRFNSEAKAASSFDHPNICTIFDIGKTDDDQLFIVMAYYKGETLKKKIERGPIKIEGAIDIVSQVAEGLKRAHKKGIIHRDIKPANIFITNDGVVKILDFGLAKTSSDPSITKFGSTIGTVSYMSPEQTKGENVDHRTDIWALGVVLYEIITGKQPFQGDYEQAVIYSIMNENPKPISGLRTGVPMELERIVNKCLAKDPEGRYPASDSLIRNLRQLKKSTSKVTRATEIGAERTVHEKETSTTLTVTPKFKKLLIGFVSAVVISLGLFAVWKFLQTEAPELVDNRVAVAYFRNESGDSSLDYLRRMTADDLTQGIGQVNFVEVSALVPENEIGASKPGLEQLKLLSERTGANIIVSGVFYKEGNRLIFQPEVNNITLGKPLKTIQHITGEISDPSAILDDLLQRVLSLLAFKFDLDWKTYSDYMGNLPTYDAYKEFKEGWELYIGNGKYIESIERFNRALELDSTFYHAYFMMIGAFLDGESPAQADSIVEIINQKRNALTLNERKLLTFNESWLNGDLLGFLQVSREIAEFDSDWRYNVGWGAGRLNKLYEAEEWYSKVDPDSSWIKTFEPYWGEYGWVLHLLGKHEDELRLVDDRRKRFPESRTALVAEILAHIALGNLQSALELKKDMYVSMEGINPGQSLMRAAMEFETHGYKKEARESIEEAIRWFSERPQSERTAHRVNLFDALGISVFALDTEDSLQQAAEQEQKKMQLTSNRDTRIQMMRQITSELVDEDPLNENYQGRLVILYAQLGDRENASRIFRLLSNLDRPFLHGKNIFWQAAIAAQLGELSRAVTLLYDAQSKGNDFGSWFHRDPIWRPLRNHAGFKEFMRPKK